MSNLLICSFNAEFQVFGLLGNECFSKKSHWVSLIFDILYCSVKAFYLISMVLSTVEFIVQFISIYLYIIVLCRFANIGE